MPLSSGRCSESLDPSSTGTAYSFLTVAFPAISRFITFFLVSAVLFQPSFLRTSARGPPERYYLLDHTLIFAHSSLYYASSSRLTSTDGGNWLQVF